MPTGYFRRSRWMGTVLVLLLLLTACAPRTLVPTTAPISPAAARLSPSPYPSLIPSPSLSAPTETPAPQPTLGPDAYRLKPWTEQDALDAIVDGEKRDPTTGWHFDMGLQGYLFTLEREALLRFPNGTRKNELEWKYAREEAILGNDAYPEAAPVDRFVRLLREALDSRQVTPDKMEAWLADKGFSVVSRHLAPNLLGDGQLMQVLEIEMQDFPQPADIVLAVAQSPGSGGYRVYSVRPYWLRRDSTRQALEDVAVVSVNGNERPEIQTVEDSAFPAICESELSLYEWKGEGSSGHFENILDHVHPIEGDYRNSRCKDPWRFGAPDARGAQPLIVTLRHKNWGGNECSEFEYEMRYEWDGTAYRQVSGEAPPLYQAQPLRCLVGWANVAASQGLYDQAIPLVASALADWPKEVDTFWGASAKDLFRFKLGTWYAFQGDYANAASTLQDVLNHPANPTYNMVPRMAETYLSRYQTSRNPDIACGGVEEMLTQEFDQTPDKSDSASSRRTIRAWGFGEPDWTSTVPSLAEVCDRGWRPDLPSDLQYPTPTPDPAPPTPQPTETPSPSDVQWQTMALIEETLFTDRDARQASQLIERLFAAGVIEPDYAGFETAKDYYRYLLGLAYELSGDERKAVDNYWRLQKDYPDSLYSRVAGQKMKRVTP